MKVSWVILTHNRREVVDRCLEINLHRTIMSGAETELIWVDNYSDNPNKFLLESFYDIKIRNKENAGVARGYNQGFAMAKGAFIVITGCDRVMPMQWLHRMIDAFDKIPNMGCVSCYSEHDPTRYPTNQEIEQINGVQFMRALPFEARMFRRSMLTDVGYFHEGFGLYGWEDCHWGPRFVQVAKERDLICCTLPEFKAEHLGVNDDPEYKAFKKKESGEPWKLELLQKLAKEGYPKFNPFL